MVLKESNGLERSKLINNLERSQLMNGLERTYSSWNRSTDK